MESARDVRVRLFFGVLFGIATGMFIAEALPHVIWWLAIPAGAVLGGTMFVAPEVRRAVPVAAKSAWQSLTRLPAYWKLYQEVSLERKRKWQMYVAVFSTLFLGAGLAIGSALAIERAGSLSTELALAMMLSFTAYIFLAAAPVLANANRKVPVRAIVYASPPGPFLFIVVLLALFMRFLGKTIWRGTPKAPAFLNGVLRDAGTFLVRFSVELFWQVNSKPLVITAIGSGVGVGMFFPLFRIMWQWEILPAAVTGAVIGAVASLAYHELVPKRALKAQN